MLNKHSTKMEADRVVLLLLLCCGAALANFDELDESRPALDCNRHDSSPNSCQNFARFCINMINDQIRKNLNASYTYDAMAKYFQRDDVAYRGFGKYFSHLAEEQREQSQQFMGYLLKRGGRLRLKKIHDPKLEWKTPLEALEDALRLEHDVNDALLDIHWVASEKNDPHLTNFLEGNMMNELVDRIYQISQHTTLMKRLDEPSHIGWHFFDQDLYTGTR